MIYALLLLSIIPIGGPVRESVAAIERNFYYDDCGRLVFEQAIFKTDDLQVQAWRLIKSPSQVPERDWEQGGYVTTWDDGGVIRQIRTQSVFETWTQYDPELIARETLPKEFRKELRTPTRRR